VGKSSAYYLKLAHEAGGLDRHGNYYLDGNSLEGVGRWWGQLSTEFGLSGTVAPKDFSTLHHGHSPQGEPLSLNPKHALRRPAFDLTHSLVKDASILASINDDWRRRVFEEVASPAVAASLHYLEEEACRTRRGKDGVQIVEGRGFVAAAFEHMAARSVDSETVMDPQAHVHMVVMNTTRGPDGKLRTVDSEALYHHAKTAAAVASVEESFRLQELGFSLRRKGRSFEIVGIPAELREENSKRSRQIREHAGPDASAKERDKTNWETREPKDKVDVPAVLKDWHERNERHGLTEERVSELIGNRQRREVDVMAELTEATRLALREVLRNESTFTPRKLLELTAIESQCRGVRASDVRMHVWAELEKCRRGLTNELVYRGLDQDGEERFCTRELWEIEQTLLDLAERGRNEKSRVTADEVTRAIEAKKTLTPEQVKAVRGLSENAGRIQCLLGGAGTGKTFALDSVRMAHEQAGYQCLGTAVANRAARGLGAEAPMPVMNTKKLLYELDQGRLSLTNVCLFWDEAATADTRETARIVAEVLKAKNSKLILCGDYRQHQSVGPGGAFSGLCSRLGYQELTEIIRQRHEEDREMVEAFRDKKTQRAIESLVKRKRLHVGMEVSDAQEHLVLRWGKDDTPQEEKRIIASTNAQVDCLNHRCQRLRAARGELGPEEFAVKIKDDFGFIRRTRAPGLNRCWSP
jgi:conjugative relaxase-like TrwC/TraI family protein